MQRLISLGLLAGLLGGGWTLLQNVNPQLLKQAVTTARGAIESRSTQSPSYGAPQGQSTYPPAQPVNRSPGFAPAVDPVRAPTIKIASFNIQVFGDSKASKSYVMDAIARVVRQFDVVAIQEIRTQDDNFISKFLQEYVNRDGTVRYDARVSSRLGRTPSTERYAFIFNTATINVHPTLCSVFPDPDDRLHREPYVALFQTRVVAPHKPFTFTLINAHTDPDEIPEELDALYYVFRDVQRAKIGGATEDDVILLGDLNTKVQAASRYRSESGDRSLRPSDLGLLARIPGISPLIRNQATMVSTNRLYDNMLLPSYTTVEFTGNHGVLDLRTDLGYPDGIQLTEKQARKISDHQPIWAEFRAIEGGADRVAAAR